ncbi:V-type ATP synthase subunit D [Acetivibrio sp. MSJd-27]|nr:V-type ATP synthase subunit D [Acetivibrio sp. MSJd-27]MBU5450738.1 V-type ATP synthase subunit D [Acetivibrio sp. MSJd-27]
MAVQTNVSATKANLMAIRRSLELAQTGYDLMDRKRNILIREMMGLIDTAKRLQNQIDITFRTAYESLKTANITMGLSNVAEIAQSIPEEDKIKIRFRSVMGVEVPVVKLREEHPTLPYELSTTNSALDAAYMNFMRVKNFTVTLAEVENSIYKLASAIKKTQKRANALENIIIPNYQNLSKQIVSVLEEKEREEFTRMKVIKQQKQG